MATTGSGLPSTLERAHCVTGRASTDSGAPSEAGQSRQFCTVQPARRQQRRAGRKRQRDERRRRGALDDDVEALATLYPDCSGQGVSAAVCHKVNHNIGVVRIAVYVLVPTILALLVMETYEGNIREAAVLLLSGDDATASVCVAALADVAPATLSCLGCAAAGGGDAAGIGCSARRIVACASCAAAGSGTGTIDEPQLVADACFGMLYPRSSLVDRPLVSAEAIGQRFGVSAANVPAGWSRAETMETMEKKGDHGN